MLGQNLKTRCRRFICAARTLRSVPLLAGLLALQADFANAEELSGLRWLTDEQPIFGISTEGSPAYNTEVLDNGYRLRISFPESTLSKNIRDIGEVGIVRGVFPYETDDPDRANFDILLKTAGKLQVSPVSGGFQVQVIDASRTEAAIAATTPAASETTQVETASAPQPVSTAEQDAEAEGMSELEKMVLEEIASSEAGEPEPVQVEDTSSEDAVESSDAVASDSSSGRARITLQPSSTAAPAPELKPEPKPAPVVTPAPKAASPASADQNLVVTDGDQTDVTLQTETAGPVSEVTAPPIIEPDDNAVADSPSQPVTQTTPSVNSSASAPTAAATVDAGISRLDAITYSQLPGGRVQLNFALSGERQEPGVFRINQPPRVVLDFFDTRSNVLEAIQRIGTGAVESIITAETDDRTRVILNLSAAVDFEQRNQEKGLVLVMSAPKAGQVAAAKRHRPQFESESAVSALPHSVDDVDFRRTPEGGGQISVILSSPEIGVDVREEAGEIVIDFPGTALPPELEQRLDVVDFATPVQTIDTYFTGASSRMIVSPVGEYTYSSYQVGDELVVQVNPVSVLDEEREPDEFGYVGERLSFNFQKISVRAALQVIADFTGLNFVTSDSVSGDLSLRLQDVPWDQALDTIMQVKGLAKRQKGNVVWVAPAEEIAAKERQALEAQSQVSELEPLVSELIQVNYAKAETIAGILKSVKAVDTGYDSSLFGNVTISEVETESNSLLSSRGNVTVDSRTNTILIQDTRGKIAEVRKLIAKLDIPVRQVLIETRIVEAADNFSRNIGARLGFSRVTENARLPGTSNTNIGTSIGSASIDDNNAIIAGGDVNDRGGLSVDLGSDGINGISASSYAFTLAKAGAGFANLIDLEISALEAEGTGKVIANPRLLTTDQTQARIQQGKERVFTTSVLGEGGVVTKKAVLSLTVTPQITPDDRLVLDVQVTKDSFAEADSTTINTKQIQTKVLLENGETVVIGGIYEQNTAKSTTKVPLLGDIPLLGALFRKKNKLDNRTELLIFLTPRILDAALTVN